MSKVILLAMLDAVMRAEETYAAFTGNESLMQLSLQVSGIAVAPFDDENLVEMRDAEQFHQIGLNVRQMHFAAGALYLLHDADERAERGGVDVFQFGAVEKHIRLLVVEKHLQIVTKPRGIENIYLARKDNVPSFVLFVKLILKSKIHAPHPFGKNIMRDTFENSVRKLFIYY